MHFTEPLRLEVGNEFNLNNVKEIKVTKQFLGLNMDIIGCQNVNSLSDCKTEQYRSTLKEQCHCSPLSLNPKEKVIKFDNINFRYISFQEICITTDQQMCVKNLKVDFSKCSYKCDGMDVISYDKIEINSEMARYLTQLSETKIMDYEFFHKFEANSKLNKKISSLSDQYNNYKTFPMFPTKLKGKKVIQNLL